MDTSPTVAGPPLGSTIFYAIRYDLDIKWTIAWRFEKIDPGVGWTGFDHVNAIPSRWFEKITVLNEPNDVESKGIVYKSSSGEGGGTVVNVSITC